MTADLHYLANSTVLTFVMLLSASLIRSRAWTVSGTLLAVGNRDQMPEPTPFSGRADRAAKNMLENLVLFIAALVVAHLGGADPVSLVHGGAIFFWARVVYAAVYLAGIPYVRTLVWGLSLYGITLVLFAVH
jgi:uncharacterized MAPEG superfamily protein